MAVGLLVHSRALGYTMGAYGAGMSLYSNFIARGGEGGLSEEHCNGDRDWHTDRRNSGQSVAGSRPSQTIKSGNSLPPDDGREFLLQKDALLPIFFDLFDIFEPAEVSPVVFVGTKA